ncbi:hypothetical protein [Ochrobactrum chromiisoli]|uniref:DUF2591 domain-containing protein n=1 Tax=Ochrobactrum chromiisoli TaxID=2993941 RepID=A0ABT3QM17_9HYPH|nr:hypothetical protein [Ochrobactrum chromiisoli]MCX2696668.1 hypothetical protein [Ochrobactrum chromiisoli]
MTLIDRLSKLDGPDREVDAEICILFQYGGKNSEGATNVRIDPDWCDDDLLFEIDGDPCCNPIPEVTASIDACIALAERVLPNERPYLARIAFEGKCQWRASFVGGKASWSPVPSIALLIAILRAKEASNDQ